MSGTPRTDAFMTRTVVGHDGRGYDAFSRAELAAFARELERENAALRAALRQIADFFPSTEGAREIAAEALR